MRFNEVLGAEVVQSADGSVARVRAIQPARRHPQSRKTSARRGEIRGMSSSSARRLRRLLSFVRYDGKSSFVTLTYRDQPELSKLKRDIDVFGKLIKRKFPNSWAIWKIELQDRGVWHIHMIIFNIPFWHWRNLVVAWSRIAGFDARTATDIQQIKSLAVLRKYLSKYISKTVEVDYHTGRIWGIINRKYAVFSVVSMYVTSQGLFRIRRVVRKIRYNALHFSFWIYRASFMDRLCSALSLVVYRECFDCSYQKLRELVY